MTRPLRILLSASIAASYGDRISAATEASGRPSELVRFDIDSPHVEGTDIEVAYYSRDIWEGCTKAGVNDATRSFFAVVDSAPTLRWLQVTSAGADLPMYDASLQRGVAVTTSSGGNASPIALSVLAGLLCLGRGMTKWIAAQRTASWEPLVPPNLPRDLVGQTAVIIGLGPIGREIARLLGALPMRTVGIRRSADRAPHVDETRTFAELDTVLPRCDWLILACPLTSTTHGLIDAHRIGQLRGGAAVINVARGEVVDEGALTKALASGHLSGAYLDVFETEPLPSSSPLWHLPNVIISPHNCSASTGNLERGVGIFLDNLTQYVRGEPLNNLADRPVRAGGEHV